MKRVHRSGGSIAEVASELGVYDPTLGNWVRARQVDEDKRERLSTEGRQRLYELKRQDAELRQQRGLLKRTVASR